MLDLTHQHEYWSGRVIGGDNGPDIYARSGAERSRFVAEIISRYVDDRAAPILELGCNVGRNLQALQTAGFTNLTGIDINPRALDASHQYYPTLQAALLGGTIEDLLPTLGDCSQRAVFTVAVLMHVHPDSDRVLDEMTRVGRDCIFTLENEVGRGSRWHPRNYRECFEARGWRESESIHPIDIGDRDITGDYWARVFTRRNPCTSAC